MSKPNLQMSPFVPIEKTLPTWPDARSVIDGKLPESFGFMRGDEQGLVYLATDWAVAILGESPEEIETDLFLLINSTFEMLRSAVPPEVIRQFEGKEMTPLTIGSIGVAVDEADRDRAITYGMPTMAQLARHLMGIESCAIKPIFAGIGGTQESTVH